MYHSYILQTRTGCTLGRKNGGPKIRLRPERLGAERLDTETTFESETES